MRKRSDLILWWGIGNTANEAKRHVNYNVTETGWLDFKVRKLDPAIAWAREGKFTPRVQLHWPFGWDSVGTEHQDFDAWIEASEGGFNNLVDEYVEMGRRLRNDGVQLITYYQSLILDTDMRKLVSPDSAEAATEYIQRFWDSVRSGIEAGSVGFDHVVSMHIKERDYIIRPGHPGYDLISAVRNLYSILDRDDFVMVEASPEIPAWWWHDWTKLSIESTFQSRHVNQVKAAKGRWPKFEKGQFNAYTRYSDKLIQRDIYKGEYIRLVTRDRDAVNEIRDSREGVIGTYQRIHNDKHTMAFKPDWAMANGLTAKDLRKG